MKAWVDLSIDADLVKLEETLSHIRERVRLRREEAIRNAEGQHPSTNALDTVTLVAKAKTIYAGRRARDRALGELDLFAEPAWDILLDLFIATAQNQLVSISSAALAAHVPATTGLRWIDTLFAHGLLRRQPDPDDKRRSHISLSERGWHLASLAIAAS